MCGCMFAFVVLGIWIWTNFQFIVLINRHQCTAAFTDLGAKAVSAATEAMMAISCFMVISFRFETVTEILLQYYNAAALDIVDKF